MIFFYFCQTIKTTSSETQAFYFACLIMIPLFYLFFNRILLLNRLYNELEAL